MVVPNHQNLVLYHHLHQTSGEPFGFSPGIPISGSPIPPSPGPIICTLRRNLERIGCPILPSGRLTTLPSLLH